MDGILLVYKPKGWTSFDVVARVRGIIKTELRKTNPSLKNIKVGHTGTLDPSATGLLILCIGKYTKRVPDMIRHDKTYEVEMTLGSTSNTGDQEGRITPTTNSQPPSTALVKSVISEFIGEQLQTPPAFSAIKVNGQRAYDLARAGKEVKLEPRKCTIYSIESIVYSWPLITFTCRVSSGTYIRSLVEDIGKKLGIGAYMSELRRTKVAEFDSKNAISTDGIDYQTIKEELIVYE
jgi:tRNA pseudouridine55 synthase